MTCLQPEIRSEQLPDKFSCENYYTVPLCELNIAALSLSLSLCVCVNVHVFALRPMKSESPLPVTGKYGWYYV
jgi:hypothetical protein